MSFSSRHSAHSQEPVQSMQGKKLSSYKWAIFKGCWSLTNPDRAILDVIETRRTTVSSFLAEVRTEHEYKDFVYFDCIRYEIAYLYCGYHMLDDMHEAGAGKAVLLLSFRKHISSNMALCICWMPRKDEQVMQEVERKFKFFPTPGMGE